MNSRVAIFAFVSIVWTHSSPAADVRVGAPAGAPLDGFGSSTAWYADEFYDYEPGARAAMLRFLFDPAEGLGLSLHRIRIDPSPGETRDGPLYDWTNARLNKQLALLREIRDVHAARFMASPWSPPSWMKDNSSTKNGGRLLVEHRSAYAAYLAEWLAGLRDLHGLTVDVLSLQNEPDAPKAWESCVWTPAELSAFLAEDLIPALAARELRPGLLADERTSWDDHDLAVLLAAPAAANALTHVGAHLYHGSHTRIRPLAAAREMPVWMTEFYVGDYLFEGPVDETERGLILAASMHDVLVLAGARAYFFWWSLAPHDKPAEGLMIGRFTGDARPPFTEWRPAPHSYFVGQYSRHLRPGSVSLAIEGNLPDGLRLSAFQRPDGSLALVAINPSAEPVSLRIDVGSAQTFTAERTSKFERLSPLPAVRADEGGIMVVKLTPRSVTTYVEASDHPRSSTGPSSKTP